MENEIKKLNDENLEEVDGGRKVNRVRPEFDALASERKVNLAAPASKATGGGIFVDTIAGMDEHSRFVPKKKADEDDKDVALTDNAKYGICGGC